MVILEKVGAKEGTDLGVQLTWPAIKTQQKHIFVKKKPIKIAQFKKNTILTLKKTKLQKYILNFV